jgi:hypothetical protein
VSLPETGSGRAALQIADFEAPVLDVTFGGEHVGRIAWSPYTVDLGRAVREGGGDRLAVTAYGNRQNAFGPIHSSQHNLRPYGPSAWRTEDAAWTYEYRLEPTGILSAPVLLA